jgi:RNA polymerase sigma-70 factor (ECF subfamily)
METTENTLIQMAQQGDRLAFERLVISYDRRLPRLAIDMVGNVDEAQDILQDALLSAYKSLPKFRHTSSFFTWLYRIVINGALKHQQKRRRLQPFGDHDAPRAPDRDNPEKQMLNKELQTAISLALGTLSKQERMAFILFQHQGESMRQAAEGMGCSQGAIKSYLFRARQNLKILLNPYWEVK